MNLSKLKSVSITRPRLPGFLCKLRNNLESELNTFFLLGADAADASLVNSGPNSILRAFFKIIFEEKDVIRVYVLLPAVINLLKMGILCNSFLSTLNINQR